MLACFHRVNVAWVVVLSGLGLGCAQHTACEPPPVAPTAPATAQPLGASDLLGLWAEYWAPSGRADTQRYVFLADGRFGWLAPLRDTPNVEPLQRSGHFEIHDGALVLHVERERFAPCGTGCASANEPRVVAHEPAMTITLAVGECPANEEAHSLDAGYACRSIGDQAFWRRAAIDAVDPVPFFQ